MNRTKGMVACVLSVVALVLALILQNQADFSRDYVHGQLAEHGIVFTPVANLLPDQQAVACLVANAGKPMLTGKQAECYAKYQIGLDLVLVDGGKTYYLPGSLQRLPGTHGRRPGVGKVAGRPEDS